MDYLLHITQCLKFGLREARSHTLWKLLPLLVWWNLISISMYMICIFPIFQHTHQLSIALHHSKPTILHVSLTFPRIISPSTVTYKMDAVILVGSCSRYSPAFHGKKNSSVNILQASLVWHCAPSFHTEGQWNTF